MVSHAEELASIEDGNEYEKFTPSSAMSLCVSIRVWNLFSGCLRGNTKRIGLGWVGLHENSI